MLGLLAALFDARFDASIPRCLVASTLDACFRYLLRHRSLCLLLIARLPRFDVRLDASFDARLDARFDGSIPSCWAASTLDAWFRGCCDTASFDHANRSLASILCLSMLSSMLLASTARMLAWLLGCLVASISSLGCFLVASTLDARFHACFHACFNAARFYRLNACLLLSVVAWLLLRRFDPRFSLPC